MFDYCVKSQWEACSRRGGRAPTENPRKHPRESSTSSASPLRSLLDPPRWRFFPLSPTHRPNIWAPLSAARTTTGATAGTHLHSAIECNAGTMLCRIIYALVVHVECGRWMFRVEITERERERERENWDYLGEGTLPRAIFRFRIFSNYFSQKFQKIKITVWKSDNLTMYGNFCLDLY